MSTLESLCRHLGLLGERLHIFSAGTVQTAGLTSAWTQDLVPVGERAVAAGELVELYVTLEHDRPVAALPKLRFDVLEFDWLFGGGFDDPLVSLKTAAADPPDGEFAVLERQLSEDDFAGGMASIEDVVAAYRLRHAEDFERGILVVRESDLPDIGRTHVVGWWRAQHADEEQPALYFVADVAGTRDSSTVPLRVDPPTPGANIRVSARVTDMDPADAAQAQPVPRATVTLGATKTRTDSSGYFVIDARLPLGPSSLRVSRPGIDDRTITVRVSPGRAGAVHVALLDADAGGQELQTSTVPADADPQSALLLEVQIRARVHRLRGRLRWPRSTGAALPLARRRVYAVPLTAGATGPQRPVSSRDLEALAGRVDVLRSAQPDRPMAREATDAEGTFELSFIDLRPGSQHLLWVQCADPRNPGTEVAEVIVRTVAAADLRAMNGIDASSLDRTDRAVVDSTYNLLADSVANTVEVVRVVDQAVAPAPADVRVLRPGGADPAGIDATPVRAAEEIAYDAAKRRAGDLVLEVLPLVPVFETADAQSAAARWATRAVREQLDARHPRGHLCGGWRWVHDAAHPDGFSQPWALRWGLDARRANPLETTWNHPDTVGLLEDTLLTEASLTAAQVNAPGWVWWRIDATSLADFAGVEIAANAAFAARRLRVELVPVLEPPVPRLTGLFARRHLHVSPGHGLFSEPPVQAANAAAVGNQRSARAGWASFAGEDENAAITAMELVRVVRANGAAWTSSRELEQLTLPGVVQTGADQFDAVLPAQVPDYPRLWQQNAYYWIATRFDPTAGNNPIVLTNSGAATASNGAVLRNEMAKNVAGIRARVALFSRLAAAAVLPVDAFIAIHTNANGPNSRGTSTLYLDIRPTAAGPVAGQHDAQGRWIPNPVYIEGNLIGQRFAELIHDEVIAGAPTRDHGVWSYIANGNQVAELRDTVTHRRNGQAVDGIRAHAAAGVAGLVVVNFPRVRGRDIPIGYVEAAFHSNADDALRLAQRWFRHAVGTALAKATETMIGEHTEALTGDDVQALLTGVFGPTAEVTALGGGAVPLTAAQIGAAILAVTGQVAVPADAHLGAVVTAVETARNAATRTDLVARLSRTLARVAGFDVDDATQAGDIARAALAPLLRAAGAADPAPNTAPTIADLPRAGVAVTRADAATFLAAGLGLRPASLAGVTRPIGQVTLLPAFVPEVPEAFVPKSLVDGAIVAAGRLRPQDLWRPIAVQVTDSRQNALPAVPRVAPGAQLRFTVDLAGTAWPGTAADVELLLTVGTTPVATVGCETRTPTRLVSRVWPVRLPAGLTGTQDVGVTVRARHRIDGQVRLGRVTVRLAVVNPAGNGAGGTP